LLPSLILVYSQPLPWPWLEHPSHRWDYFLWCFTWL
jgi:hypothetical protein